MTLWLRSSGLLILWPVLLIVAYGQFEEFEWFEQFDRFEVSDEGHRDDLRHCAGEEGQV